MQKSPPKIPWHQDHDLRASEEKHSSGMESEEQESSKVEHFVDNWFLWRGRINFHVAKMFTEEIPGVDLHAMSGAKKLSCWVQSCGWAHDQGRPFPDSSH